MSPQAAVREPERFMFDPAAETMPRAALSALQLDRLKHTLDHAYSRVPHHRNKLDAAGVKPSDCKTLPDLARFPFTLRTDLRDTYPPAIE